MSVKLQLLAAAALGVLVLIAPAAAGSLVQRSSGPYAGVVFLKWETEPCVSVQLSVSGWRTKEVAGARRTRVEMSVYVSRYDVCRGEEIFAAAREIQLPVDAVVGGIPTLSLRGSALLEDSQGRGTVPVHLDLTWTATYPVSDARQHSAWRGEEISIGVGADELWGATVSGAARVGDVEFAPSDALGAWLGENTNGLVVAGGPTALSLLSSSIVSAARAGDGRARTDVSVQYAVAVWERFDETGCIRDLAIVVAEDREDTSPFPLDSYAFVDVSRYDHCENQFVRGASAFVPLPDDFLDLSASLSSARIAGAVDAVDYVTTELVTLDIDVRLTGTGPVVRSNWGGRYETPELVTMANSAETSRAVTAAGTVRDGAFDYLDGLADHFVGGGIGTVRYHEMTSLK